MSKDDLRNYQLQLDQVNDGLSLVPDDQELLSLKEELTQLIDLLQEELKLEEAQQQEAKNRKWQTKPKSQAQLPPPPTSTSPTPELDSLAPPPSSSSTPKPETFKVGDVVSAKWVSGDGAFYAAKITQVTGLSTKPNYTVKFLKWEDSPMETLPYYHVQELKEHQKRKVGAEKPPPPKKIDPQAREAAEEKKRRKLREKQELERTKQNWQSFAAKGPKKRSGAVGKAAPIGSNSMFKTPDTYGGRGMFSLPPPLLSRMVC